MKLDQDMRERLSEIAAGGEDGALGEDAQDRIARAVRERGPEVMRRAENVRLATQVGGALALAAVVVLAFSFFGGPEPEIATPSAVDTDRSDTVAAAEPAADDRPCARFADDADADFDRAEDGGARLAREGIALFVAAEGAEVSLVRASSCATEVRLDSGVLAVHAIDLGGGELRVSTPLGDVRVRGTIFSVAVADDGARVVVDEGQVQVFEGEESLGEVGAGAAASFGAAGFEPANASSADRESLRRSLGLATEPTTAETEAEAPPISPGSRASAASPTSETLVAEALAARSRGDLAAARRLLRRAGAGRGYAAETAWITLARLELAGGDAGAAEAALREHRRRFADGAMIAEARWLAARAARARGDRARALELAREIVAQHGGAPQAEAARRMIADLTR